MVRLPRGGVSSPTLLLQEKLKARKAALEEQELEEELEEDRNSESEDEGLESIYGGRGINISGLIAPIIGICIMFIVITTSIDVIEEVFNNTATTTNATNTLALSGSISNLISSQSLVVIFVVSFVLIVLNSLRRLRV